MFGHCTDTSVHVHNHTLFPIKAESARSALRHRRRVSAPRRSRSFWAAFFLAPVFSIDRPPRRSLPRPNCHSHCFTSYAITTHCCQACHPLLQCHSCPKNTGKPDLWPLVLAILVRTYHWSYQPGFRGSVELYPPCWDNWLRYVCTLHKRVHTVYIHVHTLYISTTYCMHLPLLWLPLHTRL